MTAWVLLRGLAREARHWEAFPAALARVLDPGDRVLALDLPGNGKRWGEASPWSVAAMAEAVRHEVARRHIDRPLVLVGLSLGGMVALHWAAQQPQRIAGCVAINTSLGRYALPWQRLRPSAASQLAALLPPWVPMQAREAGVLQLTSHRRHDAALLARWTAFAEEAPTAPANAGRQLVAAACYRGPASAPQVPVLLLASTKDRLVSPQCSRALAAAWRVPLQEHPWAGHDLPLDAPAWAAAQAGAWWSARPR